MIWPDDVATATAAMVQRLELERLTPTPPKAHAPNKPTIRSRPFDELFDDELTCARRRRSLGEAISDFVIDEDLPRRAHA